MPAADSSFSRPSSSEDTEIAVTLSLDGVVLESSAASRSLSEIAQLPFDRLVVTLVPCLVGAPSDGKPLPASVPLELVEYSSQPPNLRLIYRKQYYQSTDSND